MSTSQETKPTTGKIGWIDLTVPDAENVRDFYKSVVGWESSDVPMGDYSDFCMHPTKDADPVTGICHARGTNESLPAQWMIYINVDNLDKSVAECEKHGGEIVVPTKTMGGHGRYCIIRDPAGAVSALFEPAS